MGFFSKIGKKFKKATGISFAPFDFLGSVESFINDPTGAKAASKKQVAALRAAGKIEEAAMLEAQMFRAQIISETAPLREQAIAELTKLKGQRPGETEFFRQGLEQGTEALAGQAARFGLLESGATGQAFGKLGAGLLSQEELIRQQGLERAAGLSTTGFGLGLGALGQESALAGRRAQTEANIGAAQAAASGSGRRFWTGLATQFGGAALGGYASGLAGVPPAAGAAGGFSGVPDVGLQAGGGFSPYQSPFK